MSGAERRPRSAHSPRSAHAVHGQPAQPTVGPRRPRSAHTAHGRPTPSLTAAESDCREGGVGGYRIWDPQGWDPAWLVSW